jgi:hypothetical protein
MLTQSGGSDNCCAKLCAFAATGIPMAFCGKRSKERQHAWSSADSSSPAGKFVLTRLAMAEKVEKAGIWIWFGMMGYLAAGVGYLMFQPTTVSKSYVCYDDLSFCACKLIDRPTGRERDWAVECGPCLHLSHLHAN